jgi:hypothetical protein
MSARSYGKQMAELTERFFREQLFYMWRGNSGKFASRKPKRTAKPFSAE